ncbi:putative Integrase family protein [Candidatus Terasakiella magnetica]|nr:putative Integrase family protein [Candidatus Terasakiella magnetica]
MPSLKLTSTAVKNLTALPSETRYWDTTMPGFCVRVWPSGKKFYMVQFRDRYRRNRVVGIGDARIISFEIAKETAQKLLAANILGEEFTPKKRMKLLTISDLMEKYIEQHIKVRAKGTHSSVKSLNKLYINPEFGKLPYQELTYRAVRDYHEKLTAEGKPSQADNVVKYIISMWNWAIPEVIPDMPCPALKIEFNGSERRERVLSDKEYTSLWKAIDERITKPKVYKFSMWAIEFIVLTGIRKNEALKIRKDNIDIEKKIINVVDKGNSRSKKKKMKPVDITDDLLDFLNRIEATDSEYLFPSYRSLDKPLSSLDAAWNEVRKDAGLWSENKGDTVWIHDLRRTYITKGTNDEKLSIADVSKAVGHSTTDLTEEFYVRQRKETKREVNQIISNGIASLRKSKA